MERERKLRHLQLDAIRTLWREIQKLHAGRKDGLNTPSTPITPLTPLTPLESGKRPSGCSGNKNKVYSEQSVKELTEFCTSLQSQVLMLMYMDPDVYAPNAYINQGLYGVNVFKSLDQLVLI